MRNLEMSVETVVAELYRSLLMREPDQAGLRVYAEKLRSRSVGLGTVIRGMIRSEEFRRKLPELVYGSAVVHPDRFTNDASVSGEVELFLKLFVNHGARHRIVVDVGAEGVGCSNSYDLVRSFGWKGYLVQGEPSVAPILERDFAGCDVQVIRCFVGNEERTKVVELHQKTSEGGGPQVGVDGSSGTGRVHVPVLRLGTLLMAHGVPRDFDLLCLTVEAPAAVLAQVTSDDGFDPQWVIVSAVVGGERQAPEEGDLGEGLRSRYRMAARTVNSVILVRL